MNSSKPELSAESGIRARVTFLDGQNELPMVEVMTAWSCAEVYLEGAHVTRFIKKNEPPMLFMSQCSRFEKGQPIRGGIPVIFPWFGPREGLPNHGFARLKTWELKEIIPAPDGSVSLRFRLPDCPEASAFPAFTVDYVVTVSESLTLQLAVTNNSDEEFVFEECFHTYFEVADITAISVGGLKGLKYRDKVANFAQKTESAEAVRFASEVDRVYLNAAGPAEIVDPRLSRKILIEKQNSRSTVVWNPWAAKARQMPDFGDEEYTTMVCVESGNVGANSTHLPPGRASQLTVKLSTAPLNL